MRRISHREYTSKRGLERLREWAESGLSNEEIYTNIGISRMTFFTWQKKFPIITKVIREARLKRTTELDEALRKRACGEEFNDEVKTVLTDVALDFRSLTFLFLPEDLEKFKAAIEQVVKYSDSEQDIFAGRLEDFERLLNAQSKVKSAYNVESMAKALTVILDIFNRHLDELSEGYLHTNGKLKHKGKVPIISVLGDDTVSSEVASIFRRAIRKAIRKGVINADSKTDFLKILAEKYLAGE